MTAVCGASIYVCKNFKLVERPDIEFLWILLKLNRSGIQKKKILIGCIYIDIQEQILKYLRICYK